MSNSLVERSKILEFEKLLIENTDGKNIISDKGEVVHCEQFPLKHSFADQVYVRQMDMKKDTLVVGAIHNHLHVWFLLTGSLTVVTETSQEDYLAPCYVISKPGVKRVIYAHEDSIFVNIHKNPDNTENIDELEARIVSKNYKEYEKYTNQKK
jgi:quercetin dioxygenase-like cupin family protein